MKIFVLYPYRIDLSNIHLNLIKSFCLGQLPTDIEPGSIRPGCRQE